LRRREAGIPPGQHHAGRAATPTDRITLPPERATETLAAGRYRNVAELAHAGLSLLQRAGPEQAVFAASPEAASAEDERDGCFTGKPAS